MPLAEFSARITEEIVLDGGRETSRDEAIAEAKRAQEADPVSPDINATAARTFYFARRYDQAIEQSRKTLEMDPSFPRARWHLAMVYEQVGRYEEAIAECQKAWSLAGGETGALGLERLTGIFRFWRDAIPNVQRSPMKASVVAFLVSNVLLIASVALCQQETVVSRTVPAESSSVYTELDKAPEKARTKTNPLSQDPNAVSAGRVLFQRYCADCHGENAQKGSPRMVE